MKGNSIRRAGSEDATLLSQLATQTFQEAFASANHPADMEAYVANAFALRKIQAALRDPRSHFWIAFDPGNTAIGYLKILEGSAPTCVQGPNPVALQRLYLTKLALGTGVGAALMQTALNWAESSQFGTVWLGVWEENQRAIEFYRRWGFDTVGEQGFQLGRDEQTDLIMERSLAVPVKSLEPAMVGKRTEG